MEGAMSLMAGALEAVMIDKSTEIKKRIAALFMEVMSPGVAKPEMLAAMVDHVIRLVRKMENPDA